MSEDVPESFDKEYVSQLRNEAGKYRQQVKELKSDLQKLQGLEAQVKEVRIENELVRRGVQADPSWVKLEEGQNPSEAVENFLEKYPQFSAGDFEPQAVYEEDPQELPRAMPPKQSKANVPGPKAQGALGHRSLDEVKKDPVARQNLREQYRSLLSRSSNQSDSDF